VELILASGSARRRELLGALGLEFRVEPADVDETSDEREPTALAAALAERKARAVAARHASAAVLGADTIVARCGRLFGKPADAAAARATLEALRGHTHQVVTGVAVVAGGRCAVEVVTTQVTMRAYGDAEIAAYVASGDPLDKSGAYAVQHSTFAPAERVEGCLCSVVGLPLWTARALLWEVAGIAAGTPPYARCIECPGRGPLTPCPSPRERGEGQESDGRARC